MKDVKRTEEWQKNCGNITITTMDVDQLVICEEHFLKTDININNKRKLLNKFNSSLAEIRHSFVDQ